MNIDEIGARIIIGFGDGKVFITESILLGLIVAAVLSILGIWLGSGLKTVPKGKQIIAEFIVGWIYKFTGENMGRKNLNFAPYVGTIFAYILLGSCLGIFGLRPITADVNVTFSLSLLTFFMIQYNSIRKLGVRGRIKEMCDPYPFMFPLKILEDCTLPISLGFRLFGNILGGVIVVDLWMSLMTMLSNFLTDVPFLRAVTVLPLNGFFDIFEPAIQTYIFTMLTMIFLTSAMAGVSSRVGEH
ncbi:MAG TPA: F0F1 ATP synthase subunit A [Anaerovoracaceae bacterium]|nr:F0F1 ATP synthase subunit A [Anaerovoracaceae bacterium]